MSTPPLLQVVGNPVAHSLSPEIHNAFARQLNIKLRYEKTQVVLDGFVAATDRFRAAGGRGMNITVPFKTDAWDYADELDDLARMAGAVNTLDFTEGSCRGYNTDGLGIVRDLVDRHRVTLEQANILLIGAGGATRGVLLPLLETTPQKLVIANRTEAKAQDLVREINSVQAGLGLTTEVTATKLPMIFDASFWPHSGARVVINATSMGLSASADGFPVAPQLLDGCFCYDMSYGANARFAQWAAACQGAQAVDGLGMLVEQAAESFAIWFGRRPETSAIYRQLRDRIDQAASAG